MSDKFRSLKLKHAIAAQIFYSSPDAENLTGRTLNSDSLIEPFGIAEAITFRPTGIKKDEVLEKLIKAKAYSKILQQYDKPGATFTMAVIYRNAKDELKEMNLTKAIETALAPLELPKQIIDFLLQQKKYSFLKD